MNLVLNKLIATLAAAAMCLAVAQAQTWNAVSTSDTVTRSFNGSGPGPSSSWTWYLPFPNSNTGVREIGCSATANPNIQWWQYSPYSSTLRNAVWDGIITGDFLRSPGTAVTTRWYSNIRGISFQGVFGGRIDSNNTFGQAIDWNALDQAVYYHQQYCFDGGSEFGFYRVLTDPGTDPSNPGNVAELTTIYFYYSTNTNCESSRAYPLASGYPANSTPVSHGVCEYTAAPNSPIQANVARVPITVLHDTLYNFSAYLVDATRFHVEVRKVADNTCALCQDVMIDGSVYFGDTANAMIAGTQGGQISIALNKQLAFDSNFNFFGVMTTWSPDVAAVGINSLNFASR